MSGFIWLCQVISACQVMSRYIRLNHVISGYSA